MEFPEAKYNAIDVAMYVVNICNRKKNFPEIFDYNLQPILFLIQADFLMNTEDHRLCFKDTVYMDDNIGIKISEVQKYFPYYVYLYLNDPIPFCKYYYTNNKNGLYTFRDGLKINKKYFDWNTIDINDRLRINDVLKKLNGFSIQELNDMIVKLLFTNSILREYFLDNSFYYMV